MSDDQQTPEAAPEQALPKADLRKAANWYKRGPEPKTLTKAQAEKLLPDAVKAALGAKAFSHAAAPLSEQGRQYLNQALRTDVDEWRKEFAAKLRTAADELLDTTMRDIESVPPSARGFLLAVLVDKAQAIENKNAMSGTAVNVQINHFGSGMSKEDLIKRLKGESLPIPVDAEDK